MAKIETKNTYTIFARKPMRKWPRRSSKDNDKIDLIWKGCEDGKWMELV